MFINFPRTNLNTTISNSAITPSTTTYAAAASPKLPTLTDGSVVPPTRPPTTGSTTAITNMEVFQQLVKYGNELKAMEDRYAAQNRGMATNVVRNMQ